jgi:hypothetical protein
MIERGTYLSAQKAFTVNTDWTMSGFIPQNRGYNPYENMVDASNVNQLTETWIAPIYNLANFVPFVVVNGNVFSTDIHGGVHAYSSAGVSLWTATIANTFPANAPVSANGLVFFGDGSGNVYAFKMNCRTDGGVCAPTWTTSIGADVTSGLTLYKGKLYAPSDDNSFHVLDPATGSEGTPIYAQDKTHGAIDTPIAFAADGTFFYGSGNYFSYSFPNFNTGYSNRGNQVSPIAVYGRTAFFTLFSGNLYEFGGANWNVTVPGGGCGSAPVVANSVVYAGGCSGIGAYSAIDGGVVWTIATGPVFGLSLANGVLYVCDSPYLKAYSAATGAKLWSIGYCDGAPKMVNGTLYQSADELSAFNLPGNGPDKIAAKQPKPRSLRPDYALRRQKYYVPAETTAEE